MQIGKPPESKRRPSANWTNKVRILKDEHPGEYGMVGNFSVGVATHIREGDYPAFLADSSLVKTPDERKNYMSGHWHVTTRRTPDGRNDVWVAWLGKGCVCRVCDA